LRRSSKPPEQQIERLMPVETQEEHKRRALDLHDLCILYVGGRNHQIPQLKGLVEGANGRLLQPRRGCRAQRPR
jgi:hypothetical protein